VILDQLRAPIVLAPLAGGPSTPQLAAAVSNAGGLGFLAAGYLTATALAGQVSSARQLTGGPLGVNLFVPAEPSPAAAQLAEQVAAYAAVLAAEAGQAGIDLGQPRFDDDDWDAKLALLAADPVAVTSFTFGCPAASVLAAVKAAGSEAWITVTTPDEAELAAAAGADVLVVQGSEAGGHRGSFRDDPADDLSGGFGLLALLQLVRSRTGLPLVAAGGIGTGAGIAAVLAAGAAAAQLGTAFLRCPEAGSPAVQRDAVASRTPTALTRAFTGRLARGVRNAFIDQHSLAAPAAYPHVHYLTAPLRAHGRTTGQSGLVNLWAGQAHELSREWPAAELVAALADEARSALARASAPLTGGPAS
jgi:nitronate monooxygenase